MRVAYIRKHLECISLYVLKGKSGTMKFDFSKSTDADFRNKLQSNLGILMSNILYITHEMDLIKKVVMEIKTTLNLQKQVDDYFEDSKQEEDKVEN